MGGVQSEDLTEGGTRSLQVPPFHPDQAQVIVGFSVLRVDPQRLHELLRRSREFPPLSQSDALSYMLLRQVLPGRELILFDRRRWFCFVLSCCESSPAGQGAGQERPQR